MRKVLCILMAALLVFSISGCARLSTSGGIKSYQTDKEQARRIDGIISKFDNGSAPELPAEKELSKANGEQASDYLMDFAEDMARAQFYGLSNDEILTAVGEMVKNYPHPLVLNNYAAMLTESDPEDALYLLLQALDYEPGNPVLLCNIANIYIKLNDFGAAERYAKEALQTIPGFGPAYQVLTTVHLKNGDSVLAAETMVKSAKHVFNDITEYHFLSFLMAVQELDPKTDEYPLKEEFIKELYEIARENVDTLEVDQEVDTPEAQLSLKSLPEVNSADDLSYFSDYLGNQSAQTRDGYTDLELNHTDYKLAYDDEKAKRENKTDKGLIYPVEKNLRQQNALDVLTSYYLFKLDKIKLNTEDKINKLIDEFTDKCYTVSEKYYDLGNQKQAEWDAILEDADKTTDIGKLTELEKKMEEILINGPVELAQIEVQSQQEQLIIAQEELEKVRQEAYASYNETKQLLEEYWLRAGGILKYISNDNLFNLYDIERRMNVIDYISSAINNVADCANRMTGSYDQLEQAKNNLEYAKALAAQGNANRQDYDSEDDREGQKTGAGLVPEMQEAVIGTFQEKNAVGELGVEFDLMGYIGAAGSYDGEDYSLELSGSYQGLFKGTVGGKTNNKDKEKESYATFGVNVEMEKGLIPEKIAEKEVGKMLGTIKFGASASRGFYNVMGSDNKVKDFGTIKQDEFAVQLGLVGGTSQTQVKKSLMTGVAIRSKAIKYKFAFLTYTVPNN